jgi:hypothetical protein
MNKVPTEIWRQIVQETSTGSYTKNEALKNVALLSRSFNRLAREDQFWAVGLSAPSAPQRLLDVLIANPGLAQHVHEIFICNLQGLGEDGVGEEDFDALCDWLDTAQGVRLAQLLARSRRSVKLMITSANEFDFLRIQPFLVELTCVTALELTGCELPSIHVLLEILYTFRESLEELHLSCMEWTEYEPLDANALDIGTMPVLRTLAVAAFGGMCELVVWLSASGTAQRLRTLEVLGFDDVTGRGISALLRDTANLERLVLDFNRARDLDEGTLLGCMPPPVH